MNDYALVPNTGSSSLNFRVYARPQDGSGRLEARSGSGVSAWVQELVAARV